MCKIAAQFPTPLGYPRLRREYPHSRIHSWMYFCASALRLRAKIRSRMAALVLDKITVATLTLSPTESWPTLTTGANNCCAIIHTSRISSTTWRISSRPQQSWTNFATRRCACVQNPVQIIALVWGKFLPCLSLRSRRRKNFTHTHSRILPGGIFSVR